MFVHAGFNDKILNPFQDTYSMVWKIQVEYFNPLLAEKTIIHGHKPISVKNCEKQISEISLQIIGDKRISVYCRSDSANI